MHIEPPSERFLSFLREFSSILYRLVHSVRFSQFQLLAQVEVENKHNIQVFRMHAGEICIFSVSEGSYANSARRKFRVI